VGSYKHAPTADTKPRDASQNERRERTTHDTGSNRRTYSSYTRRRGHCDARRAPSPGGDSARKFVYAQILSSALSAGNSAALSAVGVRTGSFMFTSVLFCFFWLCLRMK